MSTVSRKRRLPDSDDEEDCLLRPPVESDLEDSPQPMMQSKGPENTTDRETTTSSKQRTDMSSSCLGLDGDDTDIESDEASESLLPRASSLNGREPPHTHTHLPSFATRSPSVHSGPLSSRCPKPSRCPQPGRCLQPSKYPRPSRCPPGACGAGRGILALLQGGWLHGGHL
ncbi:hypothetical protein AALO_G00034890 [Alosa alosa]|uniref:Uncharacterized protein n=1 Tax=Alosa alosa TaxID=278164 RepID=A0AAV6H9I6_9TELE|nr:hypothetical protein AALO_G00034890 [Alosa alosa]